METRKEHTYQPIASEIEYYDLEHRSEIREGARKLRRQYLRYKEAEIIYSMSHKKLLELAGKAGAIFRMDGTTRASSMKKSKSALKMQRSRATGRFIH